MNVRARKFLLRGCVQGCGLRPVLARWASQQRWEGSVRNTSSGVELLICGDLPDDGEIRAKIARLLPEDAVIEDAACESDGLPDERGFQIVDSSSSGPVTVALPRDLAICSVCLQESRDPRDRRFGYPFITCAQCGPRYSILRSMPFDRRGTTMSAFPLCSDCQREYDDPQDRRFHAQTISCPQCGPRLWACERSGQPCAWDQLALEFAADQLRRGGTVAVRGIGGYQLLVDATSSTAVSRLREQKRRPAKPLAVMCRTLHDARRLARLSAVEERQLCSAANPIVLARSREFAGLAAELHPGLCDLGLMLPTAALHDQLLERVGQPLVCTSGNREGEPLTYRVDEAHERLRGMADLFLHHDREIQRPIDDSVVRVIAERAVTIRAARGIAPLPLSLPASLRDAGRELTVLACGGQQKAAAALAQQGQALLLPHVGDLDALSEQERWLEQLRAASELTQTDCLRSKWMDNLSTEQPRDCSLKMVCDRHPGYFPTQWAGEVGAGKPGAGKLAERLQSVGHHHAHVVAGMLEQGWLDRIVLGVAWDGTGLGPDGTIWGGEFLRTTATSCERVADLRPFVLPGGEAAIHDVWRIAVALLSQLEELAPSDIAAILRIPEREICQIQQAMKSRYSPSTTSCGRLFDGLASVILKQRQAAFEGQAAMLLESACDLTATGRYRFELPSRTVLELDWRPVLREILADDGAGIAPGVMSMRYHRALAGAVIEVAGLFPDLPVVLAGGVFQNRVLIERIAAEWPENDRELGLPGLIPPNDGGLAAGQLMVGLATASPQETEHVSGSSRSIGPVDRPRSVAGAGGD